MRDLTEIIEEEKPYDETVVASETSTVTFRDYGDGNVWIGLREGCDSRSPPKVFVQLNHRQQVTLSSLFIECRRLTGKMVINP